MNWLTTQAIAQSLPGWSASVPAFVRFASVYYTDKGIGDIFIDALPTMVTNSAIFTFGSRPMGKYVVQRLLFIVSIGGIIKFSLKPYRPFSVGPIITLFLGQNWSKALIYCAWL